MSERVRNRLAGLLILSAVIICLIPLLTRQSPEPFRIETGGKEAAAIQPIQRENPEGGINVNEADAEELTAIKGIGPYLAEMILNEREENGPFRYPEDLLAVKGIGEVKLSGILDQICIPTQNK